MTRFWHASARPNIFKGALERYFSGELDPLTLERFRVGSPAKLPGNPAEGLG